ncbi:MAG: hypothetical protein WD851_20905 [Pirellulales bacterium]
MPTEAPAIDSRTKPTSAVTPGLGPLPVLARIPWVIGDSANVGTATAIAAPNAPPLTHFEYLMGEFGFDCDAAPPLPCPVVAAPAPPSATPLWQHAAPPSPRTTLAAQRLGRHGWAEIVLRIDAAIEPYTRAIVLLVLMAVAAFTVLLLRSSEDPAPTQLNVPLVQVEGVSPSASATQPKTVGQPKQEAKRPNPSRDTQAKSLTAEGPAGGRSASSPPIATLSNDIQPASPEAIADTVPYPSTFLPASTSVGSSTHHPADESPQEARQRGQVAPIHPYK